MPESSFTQREFAQFRGPTTSDNYNERIENLYKDLLYLYNKIGLAEEDMRLVFQRIIKDHISLGHALADLETRMDALEGGANLITFGYNDRVDNDRFNSTSFNINLVDRLFHDSQYGLMTLPKVESSSSSKIKFVDESGNETLPSTFEAVVRGNPDSADDAGAYVDSSNVYDAFLSGAGKIWERNVIVDAPVAGGAELTLYVKLPFDLSIYADTNAISISPFPMMGTELLDVSYTTDFEVSLNDFDGYAPINKNVIYIDNEEAIGWIAPGGWEGDSIVNSGPKTFYFEPKPITAIRIKLRQKNYYVENGKYVYTYGLASLDARYDKFLSNGKAFIRFDAPDGETISDVESVQPQIWNVSEGLLTNAFDYRIIWETAFNSGVYTTTPVPFSQRVWIEVSLAQISPKASPALSGLVVSYT